MPTIFASAARRAPRPREMAPKSSQITVQDKTRPFQPAPLAPQWFVLMTEPQRERAACDALTKEGYFAWYPEMIATLTSARLRKRVLVNRPLFPRYIFAAPSGRSTKPMRACDHVSLIVHGNMASDALIRDLSDRQMAGEFVPVTPEINMKPGDVVRTIEGPFASLDGIVSKSAHDRIGVIFHLFGRQVEVNVHPDALTMARKSDKRAA